MKHVPAQLTQQFFASPAWQPSEFSRSPREIIGEKTSLRD
jgi:hypothetical protein